MKSRKMKVMIVISIISTLLLASFMVYAQEIYDFQRPFGSTQGERQRPGMQQGGPGMQSGNQGMQENGHASGRV